MNTYIENLKQALSQGGSVELESILQEIYFLYLDKLCIQGELQRCTEAFEVQIDALDFPKQNAISCAVNDLCSEYIYVAFSSGFRTGAGLILSLLTDQEAAV